MFRNIVIVCALFVAPLSIAHGQLLDLAGSVNTTQVTVGTTTFDVAFENERLQSAQSRLQQILFYLRTFDSDAAIDTALQGSRYAAPSVYNNIIDAAFQTPSTDGVQSIDTIRDLANSGSNDETCSFRFTQSLQIGDRSSEVLELQRFLNRSVATRIAASGPGSPGEETDYFGTLTLSAVFAFQDLYSADILIPLNLSAPTGFWGPASFGHANELNGCE